MRKNYIIIASSYKNATQTLLKYITCYDKIIFYLKYLNFISEWKISFNINGKVSMENKFLQ